MVDIQLTIRKFVGSDSARCLGISLTLSISLDSPGLIFSQAEAPSLGPEQYLSLDLVSRSRHESRPFSYPVELSARDLSGSV